MATSHITYGIGLMMAICSCGPLQAQDTDHGSAAPPHWTQLTDSVGQAIGLRQDQQAGWHERNAKWNKQYEALGNDAEHKNKHDYITLHSAREFDLKGFLTGGQYDKWQQLSRRSPHLEHGNPKGTNMPSDR